MNFLRLFRIHFILLCFLLISYGYRITGIQKLASMGKLREHRSFNRNLKFTTQANLFQFRGGASNVLSSSSPQKLLNLLSKYPVDLTTFFQLSIFSILGSAVLLRIYERFTTGKAQENRDDRKDPAIKSLQIRFLAVFLLLRLSDWLHGPYFYEVYSSKVINGFPLSMDVISKLFLVGFASTGICGPFIGRMVDTYGRKLGTLLFVFFYSFAALSITSSNLILLILGRFFSGLGTSLLFSAPEAWLVGEFQKYPKSNFHWLSQTFAWAYTGDAIIAILAGQMASGVAKRFGPTGPFLLSIGFLSLAASIILKTWTENKVRRSISSNFSWKSKPTIREGWKLILSDPKLILLGLVQSLFEGSMYIFVLQWAPAIKSILSNLSLSQQSIAVPYGIIFSSFMSCCFLGSVVFQFFQKRKVRVEVSTLIFLPLSSFAMMAVSLRGLQTSFLPLIVSFYLFEICVGMYFPSIGLLRSKYLPESHRSIIMNIYGIPLNLIVVSVFLSLKWIGMKGSFLIATGNLFTASVAMGGLIYSERQTTRKTSIMT
jgi:MFS family permease